MFDLLHKWVSGSPTKYFPFIFALSAFLLKRIFFFLIGSVKLYKLVLGPIPIVHTNFQENP